SPPCIAELLRRGTTILGHHNHISSNRLRPWLIGRIFRAWKSAAFSDFSLLAGPARSRYGSCLRGFHPTSYLVKRKERVAMAFVVCEPCRDCKYTDCVTVCPCDCFYQDDSQLYIDPTECIDCEACVPECPVAAIFHESDVP